MKKSIVFLILTILSISAVSAHGVDITADTMVIANDENGELAKNIADSNGINISVYKFTSDDEVAHQLEHMINNSNKRVLVIAYQDVANDFLSKHSDLKNRLIIIDNVTNDTVKTGLLEITNVQTGENNGSDFAMPLGIGLIIGIIIGLALGVLISKRKS